MKIKTLTKVILLSSVAIISRAEASTAKGTSSFLNPSSARAAAMGEAFTGATNDISALSYNPASLETLQNKHLSLMYEKGLADDSYGQFMFGMPQSHGSLGISFGYYNGGDMSIFDGTNERTVTAKADMTAVLGYAMKMGPLSIGVSGKYLSSELAETAKATAFAGDAGIQLPLSSRIRLGASIQNLGSRITYIKESEELPQIARAGLGISLFEKYKTTLLLDAPYYIQDSEQRVGAGFETMVGPLALRAGYRSGSDLASVTFGAGFLLDKMSIDYSYGLVEDLDNSHHVSLGMRFGGENVLSPQMISQIPDEPKVQAKAEADVTFVQREDKSVFKSRGREVYVIKPGDTLGKIARVAYGDPSMWRKIYAANSYLLGTDKSLEVGQRIVLP